MIKQILFPFDFSAQGLQAVPFVLHFNDHRRRIGW